MGDIEEVKEEEPKPEVKEPKELKDILERYGASQTELIEVLVTLFVKMDAVEKKLDSPLLKKLLE